MGDYHMSGVMIKNCGSEQFQCTCSRSAFLILVFVVMLASGCTGMQTFSQTAFPGDTIAMAIWRQDVTDSDATITITDAAGVSQSFPGNDPKVRAWINVYPDPVSKLVVGRESNQNLGVMAWFYGLAAEDQTGTEKDIYDTIVFMDLPVNLSAGLATIDVQVAGVSILPGPVTVNVLPGNGAPNAFDIYERGVTTDDQINSMERAKHYTVTFSGVDMPAAIQVDFNHNPDRENGGNGQAYVVNPRGDINSINWTDDGTVLRVIIMPAWHKTPEDANVSPDWFNVPKLSWYKFYVAGNITGLQVDSVNAYDVNGDVVTGISANVQ